MAHLLLARSQLDAVCPGHRVGEPARHVGQRPEHPVVLRGLLKREGAGV